MARARPHLDDFALPSVPPIEETTLGDEIGLYGALAPFAPAIKTDPAVTAAAESD